MTVPAKVSIIIPVKPGGAVSAVARLHEVAYPTDALEILIAEGCCPSLQRNTAAAEAQGEILYFLDDDSRTEPGFLRRAVIHYAQSDVTAVGGPSLTPDSDTPLQHAFAMTFASSIGGGGMRNRYRKTGGVRATSDSELILCNLSFRRDVFLSLGGFDERLYPNEENELMERIRRGGGVLIHDPDLAVHRSQRPTLAAFCRQLFGYGRGRGEQTLISRAVKPITFVPSLFLLYLALLPFTGKPVYSLPLLCYVLIVAVFALYQALATGRALSAAWLPVVVPLFHLCYGAGLIRGLVLPRRAGKREASPPPHIRHVKEFGMGLQD